MPRSNGRSSSTGIDLELYDDWTETVPGAAIGREPFGVVDQSSLMSPGDGLRSDAAERVDHRSFQLDVPQIGLGQLHQLVALP